jgi:polar amino acid transport system substrate-binding protein
VRVRNLSIALVAISLMIGLAACGGDNSSSSSATTAAGGGGGAATFGDCAITSTKGDLGSFKLVNSGALTVATNLPAPGYWSGLTESDQKSGLEYCIAADMANRLGLAKVTVKNVDFAALQAGQATGFDIALSQVTINDDRKKVVSFSDSYFTSDQALMVNKGTTAATMDDVKKLQLGSQTGTTGLEYIQNTIKPTSDPKVFQDTPSMFNALLAKTVDGIIFDTAIVLPQSKQPGYENTALIAQFKTGEGYGILLPKDSANLAKVNEMLKAEKDDGTLARFSEAYVQVNPDEVSKIPVIG